MKVFCFVFYKLTDDDKYATIMIDYSWQYNSWHGAFNAKQAAVSPGAKLYYEEFIRSYGDKYMVYCSSVNFKDNVFEIKDQLTTGNMQLGSRKDMTVSLDSTLFLFYVNGDKSPY